MTKLSLVQRVVWVAVAAFFALIFATKVFAPAFLSGALFLGMFGLFVSIVIGFGLEQRELQTRLTKRLEEVVRTDAQRLEGERTQVEALAAVLDSMVEGIWITDDKGVVVRHNNALKQMVYAGQELVGQRPLAVLRNMELHEAVMRACQSGEATRVEVTVEGVRPRSLEVQVGPLRHGRLGSVAVFHDVTDLRRLERVRQDFVANVSHELRTPITAIMGYAETLKAGALADADNAERMVEIIYRQSERLSELVTDLLDLSRLDAGELVLQKGTVRVDVVARRAGDAMQPKAQSKRLDLKLSLPEGLSAEGDERAIEQVLVNLLDNAVKYSSEGGKIEVTGGVENERCVVRVRDTGPGIEAKHLPRLFERFYRVDRGRSRDMGGTGLGLSIVKNLVGAMKGEVSVTSRTGEGSLFTVSLPLPKAA